MSADAYFRPNPEGAAPRIHVWRRDPYLTRRAPLSGYYAVRRQTEFVHQRAPWPQGIGA